jgi:hypothetical protein
MRFAGECLPGGYDQVTIGVGHRNVPPALSGWGNSGRGETRVRAISVYPPRANNQKNGSIAGPILLIFASKLRISLGSRGDWPGKAIYLADESED